MSCDDYVFYYYGGLYTWLYLWDLFHNVFNGASCAWLTSEYGNELWINFLC